MPESLIEVFTFGVPATPESFVRKAVACGHPSDFKSSLEPVLKEVVHENILGDEVSLAKKAPDLCCQMECKGEALGSG